MSREPPPPLPAGWKLGDLLYFEGLGQTFPSGNKLVYGQQGEVTGSGEPDEDGTEYVSVRFSGNKRSTDCKVTQVRRLHAASAHHRMP